MSVADGPLTFATQGGELSYHAVAARKVANGRPVIIDEKKEFGDVVRASRSEHPGLGVIAICTVAGTVEDSAREIVRKRPSALPPIVSRVDVPVEMALIGSRYQTLQDLGRRGVRCLVQKPAWLQSEAIVKTHFPWIKKEFRGESTDAIKEVVERDDPRYVAIGPRTAAEPLGGVVLVDRVNPPGSITSFYVLQRSLREKILPDDSEKTEYRTIISLAHPEGEGEINKCWELADALGIKVARFIPYDIGDYTKHDPNTRRGGGLLEVPHERFAPEVTEFCARVNGIRDSNQVRGPFDTIILGDYQWYPEPLIDPQTMIT